MPKQRKLHQLNARSEKYQWLYQELLQGLPQQMEAYPNPEPDNPEVEDQRRELKHQLYQAVIEIMDRVCTEMQKQAMALVYIDGYTQVEASKVMDIVQGTIHKVLYGSPSYLNGKPPTRLPNGKALKYGGAIKKIRNAAKDDPKIQRLLTQLKELE